MTNIYTPRWFELFMRPIDPTQTEREVAFLSRQLPQPRYTSLIDLCCGVGRHSRALALGGYHVVGVDRDRDALDEARRQSPPNARFIEGDMQKLGDLGLQADAVLCLWQSFGYFDETTNAAILQQISDLLTPGGRVVLDIYHRGFFEASQGTRSFTHQGIAITETKTMQGDRLLVRLIYDDTNVFDRFDWQLYTPEAICELALTYHLKLLVACTNYFEQQPPMPSAPRAQYVFEKAM